MSQAIRVNAKESNLIFNYLLRFALERDVSSINLAMIWNLNRKWDFG